MYRIRRFAAPAALLSVGMVLGTLAIAPTRIANAQVEEPSSPAPTLDVSEANAERIKDATSALEVAQSALQQDGLYNPAIRGLNPYATLVGGVDAIADLESGRGVDPLTFAGLHTGQATDEILPHLGYDANGRLTYKGKLVRMYSVERMKQMDERRAAIIELTRGGRRQTLD